MKTMKYLLLFLGAYVGGMGWVAAQVVPPNASRLVTAISSGGGDPVTLSSGNFPFAPGKDQFAAMVLQDVHFSEGYGYLGGVSATSDGQGGYLISSGTWISVTAQGQQLQTTIECQDYCNGNGTWSGGSIIWFAWSCGGCSSCTRGGVSAGNQGVDLSFPMGDYFGVTMGSLRVQGDTPSATLYQPDSLRSNLSAAAECLTDNGVIKQVRTAQLVADIATSNSYCYAVNLYHAAEVSTNKVGNFYDVSTNTPYASIVVSDPDAGNSNNVRLRVVQTGDLPAIQYDYVYDDNSGMWTRATAGETFTTSWDGSLRTDTYVTSNATGVVSRREELFAIASWGDTNLIRQILAPGTAGAQTNTWQYSEDTGDGYDYQKLILMTRADGYWERYHYDELGRVTNQLSAFGNAGPSASATECRVAYYSWTDNGQTFTAEETLPDGQGNAPTVSHYVRQTAAGTITESRNDGIRTLVTVSTYILDGPFLGLIRNRQAPDGTRDLYDYAVSADGLTRTNMQWHASDENYNQGTYTVTVLNNSGQVIAQTVTDLSSQTTISSSWASNIDGYGRPGRIDYGDGTYELFAYGCCGVTSQRDRDGTVTTYAYDAQGRQTDTTRAGVTTHVEYDAAGNVILSKRIVGNQEIIDRQAAYDQAGRLLYEIDALGQTNTYTETRLATGGRLLITTYPDGNTREETYYRDGSLAAVGGTAVHAVSYEYGADENGAFTKELRGEEWVKTFRNLAGQVIKVTYADESTEQSAYNDKGQLVSRTGRDGRRTLYAYDALGELTCTALDVDGDGNIGFGGTDRITSNRTEIVTVNNVTLRRTSTWDWPTEGDSTPRLVSVVDVSLDGNSSWTISLGRTNATVSTWDANGVRTETLMAPDGSQTINIYTNGLLGISTRSDTNSAVVSQQRYTYDVFGRQATICDVGSGATTQFAYNNAGQVTNITVAGQSTRYTYDSLGRVTTTTYPDNAVTRTSYFPTGEVATNFDGRTYPVAYTYDAQGRMTTMTTWTNGTTHTGQAVTTWGYDSVSGRLTFKKYADNSIVTNVYNSNGRLETRTSARGVVTTYVYSDVGDTAGVSYDDGTHEVSYLYDRLGRVNSITDGVGTRTLAYNSDNIVTSETYTAGLLMGKSISRTVDSLGRLASLTASPLAGSIQYGYDGASRLGSVSYAGNSASYTYKSGTSLISDLVLKNGATTRLTVGRQYDSLNRLTSIQNTRSSTPVTSHAYEYNSANQRTKATMADGSYWAYGYDSLGQVTSAERKWSNNTLVDGQSFSYGFDAIGNRTWDMRGTNTSHKASYTANNLNQYSSRTVPGFLDVLGTAHTQATVTVNNQRAVRQGDYFHKELAVTNTASEVWQQLNIVGVLNTGTSSNTPDIVSSVTGQLFVAKTPEQFTYDTDGNLTSDGRWNYTWDGENRLVKVESLATAPQSSKRKVEWVYDGQGRRVQQTTYDGSSGDYVVTSDIKFLYDGWRCIAELNADDDSLLRSYVWGTDLSGSLDGAGGVGGLLMVNSATNGGHFYCYDGNGNVTALVKASDGSTSAVYEYDPFGSTLRATGVMARENPFRFSTKSTDENTGLLYYGYRYYSEGIGRWLSRDPAKEKGGVNLNIFCLNNPINNIDLYGLWTPPGLKEGCQLYLSPDPSGPYRSGVDIACNVESCRCKKIKFRQWAMTSYKYIALGLIPHEDNRPWHRDSDGEFYTTEYSCRTIAGHVYCSMGDAPGAGPDTWYRKTVWLLQMFKTEAVCTEGVDKGKTYATWLWGHKFTEVDENRWVFPRGHVNLPW